MGKKFEDYAREGLLRCIDKPHYLEAYEPEIARSIKAAVQADREAIANMLSNAAYTVYQDGGSPERERAFRDAASLVREAPLE